jgi:hypothetical protein
LLHPRNTHYMKQTHAPVLGLCVLANHGVLDLATSPRFGAAWLGGRRIRFLPDGLMRRWVMALSMVCAWGERRPCVVISVCSRVLVAKCWDVVVIVVSSF